MLFGGNLVADGELLITFVLIFLSFFFLEKGNAPFSPSLNYCLWITILPLFIPCICFWKVVCQGLN